MLSAARKGTSVSRCANRVCKPNIATPRVRKSIGRRIKRIVNYVLPSYEALFKDPPSKEDCPICFLPIPRNLISCVPLPPATISTIPIFDFVRDHQELTGKAMEQYYPCCGKSICQTTWTTRNLSSSVTISNFYAVIVNVFCFNIRRGIENSTTLND